MAHNYRKDETCQCNLVSTTNITSLQLINFNAFTDNDECVECILNDNYSEVYLIISESLGQSLVPCIHDISRLDCLFIFRENKSFHEQWNKDWKKIKGILIDATSLCQGTFRRYEQNAIPMGFVAPGQRIDQLDPSFMYTQLFKEILLTIDFENKYFVEFVKSCPGLLSLDDKRLNDVVQLVRNYREKKLIWWYTREAIELFEKALEYHEKARPILQQSLLGNHPHLALSYISVSGVYYDMRAYLKAHLFFECSIEIAK
ncbi:unnamed protein product [Adineta ricciae]|uniref:Uncharacterized protein n=1 Tax=Adineta ricciae TaxID=249248 RepID=A0A816AK75_ADIRI|nr:unnamed protein product [Adineta ricciae]CAF1598670.1 unnamed protein product [Adineta ricciae]